jgi:AraC family transcriptional regulator
MLSVVAKIETPTTQVEVMEGVWPRPVEMTWNDPRPVVTLLLRDASYQALGRFRNVGKAQPLDRIGSVFFIPPNHELYGWGSGGPVKVVRCLFEAQFYRRMAGRSRKLSNSQLSNALNIHDRLSSMLLARLMKEALAPGFAAGVMAESLGSALLVESLGQALEDGGDGSPRGGLSRRQKCIVDDYRAELEHNVALNPPSISALATRCGLSVRQFSRRFRQENSVSAGRFLAALQIERAQRLLAETVLPLKEIAFRLGFSSAANFSTAFSAACGVSPAAYRGKVQGSANLAAEI